MKVCTKCKIEKPFSEFGKRNNAPDGLHYWCKACYAGQAKSQYDPEKRARWQIGRHGITREEYDLLKRYQGGRCAICREPSNELHLDHDHSCCKGTYGCRDCLRGLLCLGCNTGIGQLKENVASLKRAIGYLGR